MNAVFLRRAARYKTCRTRKSISADRVAMQLDATAIVIHLPGVADQRRLPGRGGAAKNKLKQASGYHRAVKEKGRRWHRRRPFRFACLRPMYASHAGVQRVAIRL
jgi:hypothetical protein